MSGSDPKQVAQQLADQLTAAGAAWRSAIGQGEILADRDPVYRDSVSIAGHVLYRVDETGQWWLVGWSNASKDRVYREAGIHPYTDELGGDE